MKSNKWKKSSQDHYYNVITEFLVDEIPNAYLPRTFETLNEARKACESGNHLGVQKVIISNVIRLKFHLPNL